VVLLALSVHLCRVLLPRSNLHLSVLAAPFHAGIFEKPVSSLWACSKRGAFSAGLPGERQLKWVVAESRLAE